MAVRGKARYTDILIRQRVISPEQLAEAEQMARQAGIKVPEALIRLGYATGEEVTRAIAEEYDMDYVTLKDVVIPPSVIELVPESVARENIILPLSEDDGQLRVVVSDPDDLETFDKLRFILNRQIEPVLAPRDAILEAINRHYGQTVGESADSMLQEFTDTAIDFTETEDETAAATSEDIDESSAPIVRLVHLLITEAIQLRASDIHIEPFEERIRVRYRIDGVLVERDSPPRRLLGAILSRIKILAKLDIAERRRPQDGRIKLTVGEKELDLRVSVIPTNHGQSVVMRILDKDSIRVGLKELGFSDRDYGRFQNLIRRPNGIILVTGPTGSGKTTSLYAALNELNTPDRKIITAEDPVEYYLPGVNQVEIRHDIGLDFARVIRAMLRQAPNIILVGEMRDLETAQMGIQASLTGHLVFSTLHTNDAPSAVTRLIDMGVPAYLVASSVIAIMAQRLVRVICRKCKEPYKPTEAALEAAGITPEVAKSATFYRGKGCPRCNRTGYHGRTALFELMLMSPKLRELTFNEAPTGEIRRVAINEGMHTLYADGIEKVLRGVTTLEEVYRVARTAA
ncbi:MAG TPA: type II/IV secretion system protein [Planctomycetaceae bacterium]|nr:type II/IV secretion system protein [Planctomycetaceae bacterium]HIQ21083.1 type II/IV secretion system protein [Planctomycetota bacterium]